MAARPKIKYNTHTVSTTNEHLYTKRDKYKYIKSYIKEAIEEALWREIVKQ